MYEDGNYRKLNAPQLPGESIDTQLNSINNLGWISGQVFTGGNWCGFWVSGNDFDFLEPRGSTDSQVTGINGRDDIVGGHDVLAGFVSFAVETSEASEGTKKFLHGKASSLALQQSTMPGLYEADSSATAPSTRQVGSDFKFQLLLRRMEFP